MTSIIDQADKIGREHGRNAASCVFDGNTTDDTYRRVLAGIESCDPEVMDAYRVPSLSGEFADDYSPKDLAAELGIESDSDDMDDAATAYEDAAASTFWDHVELAARDHLADVRAERLRRAGLEITYVRREDAEDGSLPPYRHYRQDGPGDGLEPFVDLGSIASGEDAYGQVSTVQRSNFRRLTEDYPDVWTTISYINADALAAFVGALDDDVTDVLVSLATDYPVYDDEDMSQLETDEITQEWDDYAASDFGRELPEDVQDAWDALDDDIKGAWFWDACEASGYYPEHSGVEVLWRYAFEKTLPLVAERLRQRNS